MIGCALLLLTPELVLTVTVTYCSLLGRYNTGAGIQPLEYAAQKCD